jgi:hypothetical protein
MLSGFEAGKIDEGMSRKRNIYPQVLCVCEREEKTGNICTPF